MRKQLTVALGLAVLATPAFATKARLQALGEDVNGSFYVNDNRNIWLNPAQVNNHKDLVTFEWGDTNSGSASHLDTTAAPRAEGGVYRNAGNLVYGLHLGGASNTSNAFRAAAGLGATGMEDNNIDAFVGGDSGIKWGANLGYAYTHKDETPAGGEDAHQESLRARGGIVAGDLQAFGVLSLINTATDTAGAEFAGDIGYSLGATYALQGNTLFANWGQNKAEGESAGGTRSDIELRQVQIGAGRITRLNDRANFFSRISYTDTKAENEGGAVAFGGACTTAFQVGCNKYKYSIVPVFLGLEIESTSWLTFSGSVTQSVWSKEQDKNNDRPVRNTAAVNAGATLKFGELSVDGVIGNTDANGTGANNTAIGTANNGTLRTDVLMTRVGVNYRY